MKGKFKKLFLFSFVFILIINTFMLFGVEASETSTYVLENPNGTTQYEISFAQDTYYSGKSEDDAWYQAAYTSYNQNLLTEKEIEREFKTFCRRDVDIVYIQDETFENSEDILVQGYLHSEYKNGDDDSNDSNPVYIISLRNIKVDLYMELSEEDDPICIATTYTDIEGKYIFRYSDESKEDGKKIEEIINFNEQEEYELFIRSYPDSHSFEIARDWLFSKITFYFYESVPFIVNQNNATVSLNKRVFKYDKGNMAYYAYIMSQALVIAQTFASDMGMDIYVTDLNKMKIAFNDLNQYNNFCFMGFSSIGKKIYKDFDTIMHEYGHFVQGNLNVYGADIFEIIINKPNHKYEYDNFEKKEEKEYAMELTWSEAWATVFAQIAQQHYKDNYEIESNSEINLFGKIDEYADKYDNNYSLENRIITQDSCEAQEYAVIQFLWDLYDSDSDVYNGLQYDDIDWTEEQWWIYTTTNDIETLQDFTNNLMENNFDEITNYDPILEDDSMTDLGIHMNKLNGIGKLLEIHQIAPGDLTITNLEEVTNTFAPKFSWKINGSKNNPNDSFKLVFMLMNGTVLYETEYILGPDKSTQIESDSSTYIFNQIMTYEMSQTDWINITNSFTSGISLFIHVEGYNSKTFISGPYYSEQIHLTYNTYDNHQCVYTEYFSFNAVNHKVKCKICNNIILQPHAVNSSGSNRYKPCVACGYMVDTQSTPTFEGMLSNQNRMITENGSYILDNGIIVLVDEDVEKYLNGTLVFYEENKDTDIS